MTLMAPDWDNAYASKPHNFRHFKTMAKHDPANCPASQFGTRARPATLAGGRPHDQHAQRRRDVLQVSGSRPEGGLAAQFLT
jgi:hypothetical protein